jgi:catechol 2,3-dioxygenase-like lactoylglutathione lyase family enzyme
VLNTLDHVVVGTENLDAAMGRYGRLLGRRPSWRGEHPSAGTDNVLFRLGNTYLELLSPSGAGPVGEALRARLAARGEGPLALAFGTDDAEACRADFEARGLEPGPVERSLGRDVESGGYREWVRVALPPAKTRGVMLFAIQHLSPVDMLALSPPLADEASAVSGLDHAVVRSADPEATKAFYGEGLGLRCALDREFPKWGARLIFFRVGGVTLEVAASLGKEALSEPESRRDDLWGLSWQVHDADLARARLADYDFDVSEVRPGRKEGTRVLTVRDAGIPTLLVEPAKRD